LLHRINSKIALKIAILVIIEIILIIGSFGVLAFFESLGSSLGNSINIAGKNRYLTANLLLQTERYLDGTSDVSELKGAIDSLQFNLISLKDGGTISGLELRPLPSEFLNLWNTIDLKWNIYKTSITDKIIIPSQEGKAIIINQLGIKKEFDTIATDIIRSSDTLVKQLGEKVDKNSQNLMLLQIIFGILNIGILVLILFLIARILKPIFALTQATLEVKKGNLDVSIKGKGKDELSVLSESFNSMVGSIRNYIKKLNELTKELEIANEGLKHKDQLKDEFVSMISHELKTPLVPIKGYAQMLLRPKFMGDLNEKQKKAIESIARNIGKLEALVGDVLDVYKLDMGKLRFSKVHICIDSLINQTILELKPLTVNKQISLKSDIRASGTVFCDPNRIEQVLTNLIKNSIDFVNVKDGKITVRVEKAEDSKVIFTVEDNGIGIKPEKADKLFQKFYQIDTGAARKHGGTGLGLAICRGIIEAHGEKIWVDKTYSKGAAIKFSLLGRNLDA
jgi:signal transduction histidine kinase